ncbi:MAG: universal stress protein [Chitinophagaceae bacterium]|nr:universal stress protein [Chitinophagaceae bacterium]
METLLVPTDFSATALNAARYALQLAEQLQIPKIVLYHSYEIPVTIDPMVPGIQMLDLESLKEESARELENFRVSLMPHAKGISLDSFNEYGALSEGLDDVCRKVNAGMVVMGITGGGILEERFIGSNAIAVAKHTSVPVIIVPPHTSFTRIEEIMLTSDYDKADKSIPVNLVKKVVNTTGAKLFVFNIREAENDKGEHFSLHALLQDLNPSFHFSEEKNYVEAANAFATAHGVDLIITIPKKHGFFGNLFSESHTKQLAFHSKVPVMVIHE